MAQKTEKEDTEFKVVPETITQCNNCGVIGNPVSNKMCPKCVASTSVSSAAGAIKFGEKSPKSRSSPEKTTDRKESSRDLKRGCSVLGIDDDDDEVREHESSVHVQLPAKKREVNRCSGCRRKVGLTGFRCRCGELFCGEHRYSDRHDCNYDYKAAGRESIAKENPVFKAPKILKL